MADIALNSAVRSNLRSLQSTTTLMSRTEERLSSGKKVNSALDNPSNFFTSQALDRRSSDLSNLLDSVSNSVQTLKAADNGISAISDLVSQMKSTARSAQQSTSAVSSRASFTAGAAITGATASNLLGTATAAGVSSPLTGTGTLASADEDIGSSGSVNITYGSSSTTVNYAYTSTDSLQDVVDDINAATTTTKITASIDTATGKLKLANSDGTNAGTVDDTGSLTGFSSTSIAASGNALSTNVVQTQFATDTFKINGTSIASGTNTDSLLTAINAQTSTTGVTATLASGNLVLTDGNGDNISLTDLDSATESALGVSNDASAASALSGQTLEVTVGSGETKTITFGTGDDEVDTLDELNAQLKDAGATASIDSTGKLTIKTINAQESKDLTIGGTATGSSVDASNGVVFDTSASTTSSAVFDDSDKKARTNYQNDYNDLLGQITTLAKDASYNGVNLLAGDDLKVVFSEDGSSSLDIGGTDVLDTLGLTALSGDEFLDSSNLDDVVSKLNDALSGLDSLSSKFGSQLSVVQTRQDFTKAMIGTLDDGSNSLTAADTNEEAANLATLQTRQSLIVSSLSISTSQEQNILQLLR
ncbi:flagellin hook IN motif-containing protein [Hansschlegelia quercus]|uniref:Flagellin N-terminal domain-containing protein n=1 Tax=Hansschlegelia quercus TaxID=2528245 RepID=A0A4Q9GLG2_9HYPH|nr:flagellin hook IN motif-containing protein [Hansschlegelia quercus]TBN55072.1 hypothetical protein EYR15_02720 [Hansschlegelia quercus]